VNIRRVHEQIIDTVNLDTVEFKGWAEGAQAKTEDIISDFKIFLEAHQDHIAASVHFERDDLDYSPFDAKGGIGKMYQLFGEDTDGIIEEMNAALAA
jgi:type I restriction enzyme R subunit